MGKRSRVIQERRADRFARSQQGWVSVKNSTGYSSGNTFTSGNGYTMTVNSITSHDAADVCWHSQYTDGCDSCWERKRQEIKRRLQTISHELDQRCHCATCVKVRKIQHKHQP